MEMKDNNLFRKSYGFAIKIVELCESIETNKPHFPLTKQLLRCGTSIGAIIAEANGAISKSDFSAKLSISYKESLETKYWLSLLKDTRVIDTKTFSSLYNDCEEISKILFTIIKKTRLSKQ